MAAKPNTTRREFLATAAAVPAVAVLPAAARDAGHDPRWGEMTIGELETVYDAHKAAAKACEAILNQPRCDGMPMEMIDHWYQLHFAMVDDIGEHVAARSFVGEDEVQSRLRLLMKHYGGLDNPEGEVKARRARASVTGCSGSRPVQHFDAHQGLFDSAV